MRGSAANRSAAAPIASSASNSTIGQSDEPEGLDGLLRDGELGEDGGIHALLGLVARPEVVAEGADDPVRRAPDVRGALLAQEEAQLLDEAGDAGQDHPVPAEDRRARREVRPEQLVGGIDEVELHVPADPVGSRPRSRSRPAA